MNIYECTAIVKQVEEIALQNDGDIPEEMLQKLVEANTGIEKLPDLLGFVKYLEHGMEACKAEEKRIKDMREKAAKRKAGILKYLTPYVVENGKQDIGTFKLSIRKSESVETDEWFNDKNYITTKTTEAPDKKKIKEAIKAGKQIAGARIVTKNNLQFK
jgi:hypothetical protein